jgi:hypothetical protein
VERRGDDGQPVRRWLPARLAVVAVVVLVALVVALLVRQPQRLVLTSYRGLPGGVEADRSDPEPGWVLGDDGRLAVYAAGSSTCPWRPTEVTAEGDRVTVRLGRDDGPCTADLVHTTSVVALPPGVDPDALDVRIVTDVPAGG